MYFFFLTKQPAKPVQLRPRAKPGKCSLTKKTAGVPLPTVWLSCQLSATHMKKQESITEIFYPASAFVNLLPDAIASISSFFVILLIGGLPPDV